MSSPEGWKKHQRKLKSLKEYSEGDTIVSWKNISSDLRKKAVDERSVLDPNTGLIGELYGNEEQMEFHDVHGYQLGKVSVVRIVKSVSEKYGPTYHVQLKTPFYDFDQGYEAGDGTELGQFGNFNKAKAFAVGFMRTVPTVSLADAMIINPHEGSWRKYLTEEQKDYIHFKNPEDWRKQVYDNSNINW